MDRNYEHCPIKNMSIKMQSFIVSLISIIDSIISRYGKKHTNLNQYYSQNNDIYSNGLFLRLIEKLLEAKFI